METPGNCAIQSITPPVVQTNDVVVGSGGDGGGGGRGSTTTTTTTTTTASRIYITHHEYLNRRKQFPRPSEENNISEETRDINKEPFNLLKAFPNPLPRL